MNMTHLRLYQVHQAARALIIYQLLYHYQMSENHRQLQAFFYLAALEKSGKISAKQKTASRAKSKKTGEIPSIKELETRSSIKFSRFSIEKLRQVRYFDHKSYRFNSVDTIINKTEALYNPQLWNLYAYCRNNPITYYDLDGRIIFLAPWVLNPATVTAIVAAATGGAILTHKIIISSDVTDKEIIDGLLTIGEVIGADPFVHEKIERIMKSEDAKSERKKKGTGYNPDGTEKTAAEQLEQLENAQKRFRKNKKQGGKYKQIESTKKS